MGPVWALQRSSEYQVNLIQYVLRDIYLVLYLWAFHI